MSARAAGRIAALVTLRRFGNRRAGAATDDEAEQLVRPAPRGASVVTLSDPDGTESSAPTVSQPRPARPQVPLRRSEASEAGALNSLVSYIPSEALLLYLAGVAIIAQIDDTTGSKVWALWVLFVIAFIANVVLTALSFRDRFRATALKNLEVRQVGPLITALIVTSLAFVTLALVTPGGVVIGDTQWVPVILLVGLALVFALAKVFGLTPLSTSEPSEE